LQRQVGGTLSFLGLDPREEVRIKEGYSLDFVIEWSGQRVAVEVDGPSHFVGRRPNEATLLKHRQLRHLGWRLVSIPYWEWDELAESPTAENIEAGTLSMTQERRVAYIDEAIARQVGPRL
jgi:very-short-patch-repair endonuclease